MLFEDVQWIDPTSLELLALTVERVSRLRVLLLITARPEFTPQWPGYAHVTSIALSRLSRAEGTALIERVTGGKNLPKEVMDQILERTDGVPLFVEELTKTVLESGLLVERDRGYVLEGPLPPLAIPTTLHASLMARLDRLASVREVAQIGAAIGREFSFELLSAVAGLSRGKLEQALGELVEAGLVFCRGMAPQSLYTFKHVLVRDAAYSGLLKSRRAQLHGAIAGAIEEHFPDLINSEPETLAYHLTEGGLTERAIGWWLKAGKYAAERSAYVEAIAHLRRGIEILSGLRNDSIRHKVELELHLALGPCLMATGPTSAMAVATFARARELCNLLGDPPEYLQVLHWVIAVSFVRGELAEATDAMVAYARLAETSNNRPALVNAVRGCAMSFLFLGRVHDAHEQSKRAVELFEVSNEAERLAARAAGQDPGASSLSVLSWVLWILGQPDAAIAQIAAAQQRTETVQHPHTSAYVSYYASILYALRGEPAIAHGLADRCLALSEEHGFQQWRGLSHIIRDVCAMLLEPTAEATHQWAKGQIDDYCGAGYRLGITAPYVLLCYALLFRHQIDLALDIVERGLSFCAVNGERFLEAEFYRLKARAIQSNGSEAKARAQSLLDTALTIAREQGARQLELRAARDLAELWRDQGQRTEARNLLAGTYGGFTEGFDTLDLKEAKALLDELA
jgi:tetratricopeptide (TPR) repeat protein